MKEIMVGGVVPEIEPMRMYNYDLVCGSNSTTQETEYPEEFIIDETRLGILKNQGTVGACVACVMSSLAETFDFIEEAQDKVLTEEELKKLKNELIEDNEFSEGWAYGGLRNEGMRGWGMIPSSALKNWSKRGMVKKKFFDALLEAPEIVDLVAEHPELLSKAEPYKINGYASINYADRTRRDLAIKEALTKNNYGILAVSHDYWQESHCIMIVGWNDKKNKYKIKNSWGKSWGDDYGVGEIPKSAIDGAYVVFDEEIVPPFTDVKKEDWFYKEVKNTYFAGLMTGVSDTEFSPLSYTTRGQMATILERIIKLTLERIEISLKTAKIKRKIKDDTIVNKIRDTINKEIPFVDVASDSWYYSAIKCCYNFDLIQGKTENTFEPDSYVTRAEIATLCIRTCDFIINTLKTVLKSCGKFNTIQEDKLNELINNDTPNYLDVKSTEWYFDNVIKVYQLGIMLGVSDNIFEPERSVNRAEVATITNRLTKYLDLKNDILTEIL